jgi:arabinan endo-1,5-alpha-L-arabinosidase
VTSPRRLSALRAPVAATAAAIVAYGAMLAQGAPTVLKLEGDITPVHDPAVIKERDTYYVFSTGGTTGQGIIPIRTSKDMHKWQMSGYALRALPDWVRREIPQAPNAWAPDVSFFNGRYHLYYSASSFAAATRRSDWRRRRRSIPRAVTTSGGTRAW